MTSPTNSTSSTKSLEQSEYQDGVQQAWHQLTRLSNVGLPTPTWQRDWSRMDPNLHDIPVQPQETKSETGQEAGTTATSTNAVVSGGSSPAAQVSTTTNASSDAANNVAASGAAHPAPTSVPASSDTIASPSDAARTLYGAGNPNISLSEIKQALTEAGPTFEKSLPAALKMGVNLAQISSAMAGDPAYAFDMMNVRLAMKGITPAAPGPTPPPSSNPQLAYTLYGRGNPNASPSEVRRMLKEAGPTLAQSLSTACSLALNVANIAEAMAGDPAYTFDKINAYLASQGITTIALATGLGYMHKPAAPTSVPTAAPPQDNAQSTSTPATTTAALPSNNAVATNLAQIADLMNAQLALMNLQSPAARHMFDSSRG